MEEVKLDAPAVGLEEPQIVENGEPAEPPVPVSKGIYFVRVPRPQQDALMARVTKLQEELHKQIDKLKAINGKMQTKRGEANAIRQQLNDARGIREGNKPEYEEKMGRIKELRDWKKSIQEKLAAFRGGQKGLDVKTEEDLDAKIAEIEAEISSGEVPLRVERQLVQTITKLNAQRDRVREFQSQRGDVSALEEELKKVQGMLADESDEFKIITGERDQVKTIIGDFQAKLKTVTDALADLDMERSDIESHKVEIQEQLKATREEIDSAMFEFRENRKLSLQLRDLVDAGRVEEATRLAEEQVELYMAKLLHDAAYRKDYTKLWSEQRKYIVSELLPKSGAPDAAAHGGPAGGKGAKGGKPSAPPKPQGAAKAQAAIAAALEAANLELAAQRKPAAAAAREPEPESTEEEEAGEPAASSTAAAPEPPSRRIVPGASEEMIAPSRPPRQHKQADVVKVPELPEVDYEFVPPVIAREDKEELSEKERKERIREEQRLKAAEAEERKKRRVEAAAKKKQKAAEQEQVRRQQEAEASAAAKSRQQHSSRAAATADSAAQADGTQDLGIPSGSDGEAEAPVRASGAAATAVTERPAAKSHKGGKAVAKKAPPRVEKVVKPKKLVKKWYNEYAVHLAVGGCLLVLLLLVYIAMSAPARS